MTIRTNRLAGKGAQARVTLHASLLRAAREHGRGNSLQVADDRHEGEQRSDQRSRADENGRGTARPAARERTADDDRGGASADHAAGSAGDRVARFPEQEARAQSGGRADEDRGRKAEAPAAENRRGEHAERNPEAERDAEPVPLHTVSLELPRRFERRLPGYALRAVQVRGARRMKPLLVFFTSSKSGPARRMDSTLAHLARKERHRVRLTRVDIDERPDLAERFGVGTVPTLVLVCNRRVAERLEGRASVPRIEAMLDEHLARSPLVAA
jgi:thioredoxin 1